MSSSAPVENGLMASDIAIDFHSAPGTELLFDQLDNESTQASHIHSLQHKIHGDSRILLVPQPSLTDPNDPLRWSKVKKWTTLSCAVWYAFLGSVTGPIMAAGE